MTLAFDL